MLNGIIDIDNHQKIVPTNAPCSPFSTIGYEDTPYRGLMSKHIGERIGPGSLFQTKTILEPS
jgi:hypothetical protein